jgi:outer membrane receptor for ferrienterochelin and colicin
MLSHPRYLSIQNAMRYIVLAFSLMISVMASAQNGVIKGRIFDELTNEPIAFANVALQNTSLGAVSDIDGNYSIENIQPGLYNVQTSYVGYRSRTIFEVQVVARQPTNLNIALQSTGTDLQAVEITTAVFEKSEESPISLQQLGTNEIRRNPGGNRDISRALQVLPGVQSSLSFRNDIIVRGGAPNENTFFLDGVEVPVINHFATQGSSGGPVGILNVNFIKNLDFYSGAFPANRGDALSSVLEFTQKDGNEDKMRTNFTLSATDVGLTFDGPLGDRTNYIFSVRRSYLQFLFGIIGLPFLPTFNDTQFKVKHRINSKNEITFIGLGAIDQFRLNEDAVADSETPEERQRNAFILGNLPVNEQWNYTIGANYKHFSEKGFQTFVLSRNHLNNSAEKYEGNDESDANNLILDYTSEEIETKFRFEHTQRTNGWRLNTGVNLENIQFRNSTFNRISLPGGAVETVDFESEIMFQRFGLFGSLSKAFFDERLTLAGGLRTDWINFAPSMSNPLEQLSPRFSLSYAITPEFTFNANVGRYYQLPPLTVLGFRDENGELVNKNNGVKYIQSDHYVAGFQYIFKSNTKVSVEGFYKVYDNYPFTLRDSISLANLGGDFGVIGNEPVKSINQGRAYGVEFLVQRKLYKELYGIAALTLVRSEFQDRNNVFVPSSWDNQFILSSTIGKKFKKNWEVGARIRVIGGTPFSPFDVPTSALREVWDVNGRGVRDFNRLNEERNPLTYQLDLRVDKKYFFDKWSLNVYIDVENATRSVFELDPFLDVVRDDADQAVVDPNDPSRYLLSFIPNEIGTFLPTIGIIVDF